MTAQAHFRSLADPFTDLVTTLPADAWAEPSPCDGWSAADVVDHVITTQNDFLTQQGIETPTPSGSPVERWQTQYDHVTSLLADPGVADRTYDGVFGPTTIGQTLNTFYGFDLVAHRWDVARAAGADTRFSEEELALLETSIAGFGDHLYGDGICKPAVEVGPGASRQDKVLALLGRRP